ncbi:MAG: glycosyltransferase [Hyphomicrobiales bacterium]
MRRLGNARILMYSHDTFGLGHLRRCRTIAHALVEQFKGLHVLIVSGSPIAGAFDFRARVDFVKIPSVIKLYNGEYTSIAQHIDLQETLELRQSIIRLTAESYRPDILIVDKEPLGLRGELVETLSYLKAHGTVLALGLRDVMDSPELLSNEWARHDVVRRIDSLYDSIWVYGPRDFWDPLTGFDLPSGLRSRMLFTGFLQRSMPTAPSTSNQPQGEYILVTAGGGGDGGDIMHDVLAAYRTPSAPLLPALLVLGPLMPAEERDSIRGEAKNLENVTVIEFDNRMETLIAGAAGVVGMGGYNTFCEILSFDKPSLIIPRVRPREEQLIRATRAAELGLADMMSPEESRDPAKLSAALSRLPSRSRPSQNGRDLNLSGLDTICEVVGGWLEQRALPRLTAIEGGL